MHRTEGFAYGQVKTPRLALAQATRPKIIYVVGFGRSGSTLLGELLAGVEGTVHGGEIVRLIPRLQLIDDPRCSCGEPLVECPVWGAVIEAVPAVLAPPDSVMAEVGAILHEPMVRQRAVLSAPTIDLLRHVQHALAEVTGSATVVDSSKSPWLAAELADDGDTICLLTRDPRAVVHSRTRKGRRYALKSAGPARVLVSNAADARRWTSTNRAARQLIERGAVVLRYEDLAADPVGSLAAVGLDIDTEARTSAQPHLAWGNQGAKGGVGAVVGADEGWRTEMPRLHRSLVSVLTAGERRRLSRAGR